MSKFSLIADSAKPAPDLSEMGEDQARVFLNTVHTPKLDELRQMVKAMKTSQLLAAIANAALLVDVIDPSDPPEAHQAILAAAMICVVDEFDRRIPAPKS